jgi:hypothetical protein
VRRVRQGKGVGGAPAADKLYPVYFQKEIAEAFSLRKLPRVPRASSRPAFFTPAGRLIVDKHVYTQG